jgi:hypothetical protein
MGISAQTLAANRLRTARAAAGPVSGVGFRARLRSFRWDYAPCLARTAA